MADEPAPKPGCRCEVCETLRVNAALNRGPIRPDMPEWDIMLSQIARRSRA